MTPAQPSGRTWESIPGTWKLLCALAVLLGHNLVTLTAWHPENQILGGIFHLVRFFSPLHFFLFSGYFACSSLEGTKLGMGRLMASRGLRIYVLVVAAFAWGLLWRVATLRILPTPAVGSPWPLEVWNGPIHWKDAAMHLFPLGFADHISINYATWYLYQELRIVLFFPLFRWILRRPSRSEKWAWLAGLWLISAVLEHKFWALFPLFRSSPFQSLAFGCVFLAGALLRQESRSPWFQRVPLPAVASILVVGVAVSFFESFGIRLPVQNPPLLLIPVVVGQILALGALLRLVPRPPAPDWLRKASDWSVGIYVVHPPLHVVATWISLSIGSALPLVVEICASIAGGALFHRLVEIPSLAWSKSIQKGRP